MKILVVSHEFPPIGGGGANACLNLTKGFVEQGHYVSVVTANYNGLPEREAIFGVHIHRVNSKRKHQEHCGFMEMLSFILKAWPVCKRMVKQEHYDVCQIFFGIPSGPIGWGLKKKYKLPYVIRFGGGDIPGFQKRFTKVYKLIGPAIKMIWKNADCMIANSEGLKKLAYDFYDRKPIDIVTNGVDIEYFVPIEHENDKVNILFASRLIERKGLQFIIPQLPAIREATSNGVRLTIVGDGPYRGELERLVKEYQVEDMVEFAGYQSHDAILQYYQNADVFILPSSKEGMPNVVLEAMACGLPIVMTPCEGSDELIVDNGFVCSIDEFSDCIIKLANEKQLREFCGDSSRKRVENNFSWNHIVKLYIEKYKEIVNE